MKKLALVVTILLLLILLSSYRNDNGFRTEVRRERVEDVECITIRKSNSDFIRAIDCDWGSDG